MPHEMTPLQLFGFVLHDVARLLRKTLDGYARDLKLSQAQWRTLTHLSRMQGCRQTDLAETLEVRPITLARLIDKLEKSALVERRRHPTDRRAVQLYLTDAGEVVLKKLASVSPIRAALARVAGSANAPEFKGMTTDDYLRFVRGE